MVDIFWYLTLFVVSELPLLAQNVKHDKIHTASCTYVCVLSFCHLYPLLVTRRVTKVNFQKILFSCILLTTVHFRDMN